MLNPMWCSTFTDFSTVAENLSIVAILDSIRDGSRCGTQIAELRSLIAAGNITQADHLKRSLPAFTPAGKFNSKRQKDNLTLYSTIAHLDFDGIPAESFGNILKLAAECPYTFAYFISPKGNGLKLFVKVDSASALHELAIEQVSEHYGSLLGITPDPKCKDISRLCFFSHDPNLFHNPQSKIYQVMNTANPKLQNPKKTEPMPYGFNETESLTLFDRAVEYTESKTPYQLGNRNNFIHALACNCNRSGISSSTTLSQSLSKFDLPQNEIISAVRSAYKNNSMEFGKTANIAIMQNAQPQSDFLSQTPIIPPSCYDSLPEILKEGCNVFSDVRERDVFLTGALAILSGCLPQVSGIYSGLSVFPNLFSFIVAPAASGKGTLVFAKQLASRFHKELIEKSETLKSIYATEIEQYRVNQRKNKGIIQEPQPEEPPFQVLFIPANASYAKILQHLKDNSGSSIICETEADSMGNALKQDWGNYSDMLRKAFHHESISSSKKSNNEYIEVPKPKLSVALSGTPSQVSGLIESAEDGLFSRFIFYVFNANTGWKDVSPNGSIVNLTSHFDDLSIKTSEFIHFLSASPTEIMLSNSQWQILNDTCAQWLESTTSFSGESAASIVKRLGLIIFRIAMLFSSLRKFENAEATASIECTDTDFQNSILLAGVFLEHSQLMFSNLPSKNQGNLFRKGTSKQMLLNDLPETFSRQQAVECAKKYNLSPRSVDYFLKELTQKGNLTQPKTGFYQKEAP